MNWTCAQTDERLSDYLDRLLSPMERTALEEHCLDCANCGRLVKQVSATVTGMHALEMVEPPTHLASAILDQTLGPRAEKVSRWKAWLGWTELLWQPRFAMGTASVVMSAAIVFSAVGVDFRSLTAKDLYPTNLYHAADKQAHMMYARGAKFFSDLRVVYEIQSRLQNVTQPGQPAETQPATKPQNPQQKTEPGRERNRAEDINPNFLVLASAWSGLPGRNNR